MIQAVKRGNIISHAQEIAEGERFDFGKNWTGFLSTLDESRIDAARESLKVMLEVDALEGKSFLDIGSGSGLFSLAARQMGAAVRSIDYDPQSVACTVELRRRYFADDSRWIIEEGSVLDEGYMESLGQYDVVYSWGVLHHTGDMWRALDNASKAVAPGGNLFIAIYNDTGSQAARWRWIKRIYNRLPCFLRPIFTLVIIAPVEIKKVARSLLSSQIRQYLQSWTLYNLRRGMSRWYDIIDWVGGYPYEVAKPEEVFDFCRKKGFTLIKLKCGGVGLGCNEFVFVRS